MRKCPRKGQLTPTCPGAQPGPAQSAYRVKVWRMNERISDLGKLLVTYGTNVTATCSGLHDTGDRGEWVTNFAFRKHTV